MLLSPLAKAIVLKSTKDLSSEIALRTSDTAIALSVSGDND
jgi:hypothetical protein